VSDPRHERVSLAGAGVALWRVPGAPYVSSTARAFALIERVRSISIAVPRDFDFPKFAVDFGCSAGLTSAEPPRKQMPGNEYLCSFHVPKTGGTTFAGHARASVRPEEFLVHGPFVRADRFLNNQPQIEELPDSERQRIRIVHGHGAGLALAADMRGRMPEFMMIVRDPYARFVSGFHHYNNERKDSGRDAISEEKYRRRGNYLARLLLKHFGQLAPSKGDIDIGNLMPILHSFKHILVTERLDRQLPELCTLYGLKSGTIKAQRINRSKYDLAIDREAFNRGNDVDLAIYSALAGAAGRSSTSIGNPFGYKPELMKDYLEEVWAKYTPASQLAAAYDELVEAGRKTFKLEAAFLKLTTGSTGHVADKDLLLERVSAALPQWIGGLSEKELSVAHFWSASMFMKERKLDAAEDYFRQALRLNPNHDNAHVQLAKLLYRRGRMREATMHFNRALAGYVRNVLSPRLQRNFG
jgi:tetratricopeptide (TPR) repeat protein